MGFALVMLVAAMTLAGPSEKGGHGREERFPADVTVYVDNAGIFTLRVKALTTRILATADVRVDWRKGAPGTVAGDSLTIVVRSAEEPPRDQARSVLARAYPFGAQSHAITVFIDRVRSTAEESGIEEYKLTAHVLSHEIAHILERLDRHSDTGIMKGCWTLADYQAMARKPLPFTGEDLVWIRATLDGLRNWQAGGPSADQNRASGDQRYNRPE